MIILYMDGFYHIIYRRILPTSKISKLVKTYFKTYFKRKTKI